MEQDLQSQVSQLQSSGLLTAPSTGRDWYWCWYGRTGQLGFHSFSKTCPKAFSLDSFSDCSTHTMHHQVLPDFSLTPPPQKLRCLPIVSPLWGSSPVLPLSLSSAFLEKSSLLFPFWVYLPYILQSEEHTTNATSVPSQPSSSPLPVPLVNTYEFLGGSDTHSTMVCARFPASHQ